ncbi:endonuclease III domain-containing protein [Hydrogenimonas urashimensis]|uniref:endonuclease III domain-containing protein n=1 Tax=Hydrogenimonas urashimensis TaxID=2740515 RepID=UPI00191659D8|nr:endonuclease III [Hydrogenimonas urashimensis]
MTRDNFDKALRILRTEYPKWDAPAKKTAYGYRRTPYTVTVSVTLSFRTKDEVTQAAGERLFALADTPEKMVTLPQETIEKAIYPVGFYRKKARTILDISHYLLKHFDGKVPDTEKELLKIRGIGPKAAAIILERAFGKDAVAVDVHVHRILNRWGFLQTRTPKESYEALKTLLVSQEKKGLNRLLVSFGQVICKPLKPQCDNCPIKDLCDTGRSLQP